MSTITLIRHGQANTAARDEQNYDRLSALGHRQAEWLGDHLRATREHYSRVYTGTLRRHRETAQSMGFAADTVTDARLNELEFFTLAYALQAEHGVPMPASREEFVGYMPRLMTAWAEGRLEGAPESFEAFEGRIAGVLQDIAQGHGPALVVTSGGLIGMGVRQVMGLDLTGFARTAITIMNTSVHRLHPIGGALALTQFNAVPHLDRPERQFAQTHL
ncbi:histidine phosphatase family protein [Lutimaribacter sp. EGI FJ00015]|uniref:Histidine phosphatase family protein n=1 Tax=Lutimaribacter degradans TaxID=2945989 RepID=A0ACC5ZZY8_9RHOB|nr:histidine phosphatase family protein [Lutimaribacter sp. EGI FJ00013]MCM2562919.1 histidine phosphatase family protein [Lutimaribacter sp. EGI FJ00013]MCO0614087.1 histidine phosphatase family protein [Lutimaribacter sp. EGI FJ00015]MCO0636064.1 histidine phosphatase family protein [Lutimaribacter sp. EGI FJ00014]